MKGKMRKPTVTVTVNDTRSSRTAGAIATVSTFGVGGRFRQVDTTIEAYNDNGVIGANAGTLVVCRIHSAENMIKMRHIKLTISDALLGDLPLIALAIQGALKEGVKTGSFPSLDGVK